MGRKADVKPGLSELDLESPSAPILALDRTHHIIFCNYSLDAPDGASFDQAEGRSLPGALLPPEEKVSRTGMTRSRYVSRVRSIALWAQ